MADGLVQRTEREPRGGRRRPPSAHPGRHAHLGRARMSQNSASEKLNNEERGERPPPGVRRCPTLVTRGERQPRRRAAGEDTARIAGVSPGGAQGAAATRGSFALSSKPKCAASTRGGGHGPGLLPRGTDTGVHTEGHVWPRASCVR